MQVQFATESWQGRRRRRGGPRNALPSIGFFFFASLVVGSSFVTAEDPESPPEPDNDSGSTVDSCLQATQLLMSMDADYSQKLEEASKTHAVALMSSMTDEDWSFGFPEKSNDAYKAACDEYNEALKETGSEDNFVVWHEIGTDVELDCDMPQMDVAGKNVEFFGIGDCLAETADCNALTPMDLAQIVWENAGLKCRTDATGGDDPGGVEPDDEDDNNGEDEGEGEQDESDPATDGNEEDTITEEDPNDSDAEPTDAASEENDAENLAPGENQADSGDRLPFLTDEDVVCMDATAEFTTQDAGLASAIATYYDSQILKKDDETGVEIFGFPEEAAKAMKAACELKKGHWAYTETMKFTCVIEGMVTVPLHAHNSGGCLANTDECVDMDPSSLLRAELSDLGFNCWEDEESGDGSDSGSGGDAASESSEDSDGKNADDTGDAGEPDAAEQKNDEQDSDKEDDKNAEQDTVQDASGDADAESSDVSGDLGLSESNQKCLGDTMTMGMEHPKVEEALQEYGKSMNLENSDVTDMSIGFSDESVDKLKSVCTEDKIGGYFTVIKEKDFVCDMMSVEVSLKMTNVANCIADTDECRGLDPLVLIEDLWKEMGLSCREKMEADEGDSTSSSTEHDDSDSKESNEDDLDLDLTDAELACMADSTDFIESSVTLKNATLVYQKSVDMSDPTKLGYPAASASEMEQVCEEEGGLWSFTENDHVTCLIKGRDRCINVYNFGNCIASSSNCQNIDPFVMVKGFFGEVLHFSCRPTCDQHTKAPHKSSPVDHPSSKDNFGAQQSNNSSSIGDKFSSFMTAAVVLCVIAAVALFGFFRYRAKSGRERMARPTYEMTEISDLGFRVFT